MDKFTELFPEDLTFEKKSRTKKAKKIVAVLEDYFGDLSDLSCLDLGCSVGHISAYLAKHFRKVSGVDVDDLAIKTAIKIHKSKNLSFKMSAENKIPFAGGTFNVVVFNQIYEHVESPSRLFEEIDRVLKKGGVCFFGARNKYFIMDGHYPIPFLAILPRGIADFIAKILFSKEKYDINLISLKNLKQLTSGFLVRDYTLAAIKNPHKFMAEDVVPTTLGINYFLLVLAKAFYAFVPNYLWVLIKKS